jgi:hypothetical protein
MAACEHWVPRNQSYGIYVQYGDVLYYHQPGLGNGWVEPPTDPYWFQPVNHPCVLAVYDFCVPDLCQSNESSAQNTSSITAPSSSSSEQIIPIDPMNVFSVSMVVALQIGVAGLVAGAIIRLIRNIFR